MLKIIYVAAVLLSTNLIALQALNKKEAHQKLPHYPTLTFFNPSSINNITDISFAIADIKYDGTTLKILELGEGTRSMFEGFDYINGRGAMWNIIWQFLLSKNKNIFLIDYDLATPYKRQSISHDTLIHSGGRSFYTEHELGAYKKFTNVAKSGHRSLVVIRHLPANVAAMQKFNKQYPHAIICNNAIAPFVNNKKTTDALFTDELRVYRPYAKIFAKNSHASVAKQILDECDAAAFVIKPLTGSKGEGIVFASRKNLESTLKNLFASPARSRQKNRAELNYWQTDYNAEALVEACESSKPIIVDNKHYDATLRVVFGLAHQNGNLEASILGSYWKLPAKGLHEAASLLDKKLSRITAEHKSAAPLDEEDVTKVTTTLLPVLVGLYANMLNQQERNDDARV